MRSLLVASLLLAGATSPRSGDVAPPRPPAEIVLGVDAPDPIGPWKMVVTNRGGVPVRFAADSRLLSFEATTPEDPYAPTAKKNQKTPPPVVCKLPPELRPAGVVDDRAVLLPPGARYEEAISPALYCFSDTSSKALVVGATITAKLGFAPGTQPNAKKSAPPLPPFIAEPTVPDAAVSAVKELTSEPFVLPAPPAISSETAGPAPPSDDPAAPRVELIAPSRVDSKNELTVGMNFTVKNAGGRPALLSLRRDNFIFVVDGPSGSARCGQPVERRRVPKDDFVTLAKGASRTLDVWVGEMCSDVVFDRPGLYRIWPSLAFPGLGAPETIKVWTDTVSSKEPVLVRIREGRLPFYSSPPEVLRDSR